MHTLEPVCSTIEVAAATARRFYQEQRQQVDPTRTQGRCYLSYVDQRAVAGLIVLERASMASWRVAGRGNVVTSVWVDPEYRRRGIARELMQTAIRTEEDVFLSVLNTNTGAEALYRELGFTLFTQRPERKIMRYQRPAAVDLFKEVSATHPGFGYVSVRLNARQANTLYEFLVGIGVRNPQLPAKYHSTLIYDANNPVPQMNRDRRRVFRATLGDYDMFGEGKWRSIAILLDSAHLRDRRQELEAMGLQHSHNDGKWCHISLKYQPSARDVELIRENIDQLRDLFSEGLIFEDETWEPITGD